MPLRRCSRCATRTRSRRACSPRSCVPKGGRSCATWSASQACSRSRRPPFPSSSRASCTRRTRMATSVAGRAWSRRTRAMRCARPSAPTPRRWRGAMRAIHGTPTRWNGSSSAHARRTARCGRSLRSGWPTCWTTCSTTACGSAPRKPITARDCSRAPARARRRRRVPSPGCRAGLAARRRGRRSARGAALAARGLLCRRAALVAREAAPARRAASAQRTSG